MKNLKLLIVSIISLLICACSKDSSELVDNEMTLLICSHDWVDFDTDTKGYYVYSFKPDGSVLISSYNKNGLWNAENNRYSFSGNTLSIKNSYGAQNDYVLQMSTNRYIQFQQSNGTLTLYSMLPDSEMLSMLEGKWEDWAPEISWYNSYTFNNKSNTYQCEQILDFRIDKEETGSGTFKIDRMWIEFSGILEFKAVWHIDINGDLILQNLNSSTISTYHHVNSENESNRPELAVDSPFFKILTTGSWILFDQMYYDEESDKNVQGFEMMTFGDDKCSKIKLFKNKKIYYQGSDDLYYINPITNIVMVSFSSYTIETTSNGSMELINSVTKEKWVHYDDNFCKKIMGTWKYSDYIFEFKENSTYKFTVYTDDTCQNIEEYYEGTIKIEPCFITLNPMPRGFMQSDNYFHFVPGVDDDTLYLYMPSSSGKIPLKRID